MIISKNIAYAETLEAGKVLNIKVKTGTVLVEGFRDSIKIINKTSQIDLSFGAYLNDIFFKVSPIDGTADVYETLSLNQVAGFNAGGLINASTGGVYNDKIKSAIEAASRGNATTIPPWTAAPNWQASTLYTGGAIVRGIGAGNTNNLYLCVGSTTIQGYQLNTAHGTSAASTGPTGIGGAFITDGTVVWTYVGQASSTGTYPLYSTVTPTISSDIMNGYIAFVSSSNLNAMGLTNSYTVTDATPIGTFANGNLSAAATYLAKNSGTVTSPVRANSNVLPVFRIVTNAKKWIAFGQNVLYTGGALIKGIKVNGRWLSESNLAYAGTLINPGSILLDLSAFPSGNKTIELFGQNAPTDWLYSVSVGVNEFVSPFVAPNNINIAIEGDSITQISGSSSANHKERIEVILGEKLGCYNVLNNGIGGTGLISNNSGSATTYLNRLADIVLFKPDLLVINGAHNDVSFSSASRIAAMLAYMQAIRAALPNCIIAVFGANLLGGETVSIQTAVEQDWVSAIAAFGDNNTFLIPVLTANPQLLNSANDIMFRTDGAAPYDTGSGFSHPAGFYYYHTNQLLVEGIKSFITTH